MIGWDFLNLWKIGEAVLHGVNPYSVEFSRYPPTTTLFFALFAFLPYLISYAVWTGLNLVLYIDALRRLGIGRWIFAWIFFTPALFNFLTGEVDIFFFWLLVWLPGGGWKAVIAAALLTLKPQLAVVILPWYVIRWAMRERGLLLKWVGITSMFHLFPLVLDVGIYQKWFAVLSQVTGEIIPLSSGIFSLDSVGVPFGVLLLIGLVVALWGLTLGEKTSRAAQFFGFPFSRWYDSVLMAGIAPAALMVPYSWLTFILAYLLKSNIPLATIPLAVLAWQWVRWMRRKNSTETVTSP